jgi:hypothetical protein
MDDIQLNKFWCGCIMKSPTAMKMDSITAQMLVESQDRAVVF